MKIALVSAEVRDCDIGFNMSQIEKYMREAKELGAKLVCFGESYLQGFECLEWNYETDKNMAVSLDSPEICRLSEWTVEIGIDLMVGFIEKNENKLYSSCVVLSEGKIVYLYRRISKGWKEFRRTDSHYQEGDCVKSFYYGDKKCLIALCGDLWEYPERFCKEVDLLFWPVFVNIPIEEWEKTELAEYTEQAKSVCSDVLFVNSIVNGNEPAFGGCYHFVDGEVKEALSMGENGILVVEI